MSRYFDRSPVRVLNGCPRRRSMIVFTSLGRRTGPCASSGRGAGGRPSTPSRRPADCRQAAAGLGRQVGIVDLETAARSDAHRFDSHGSGVGLRSPKGWPDLAAADSSRLCPSAHRRLRSAKPIGAGIVARASAALSRRRNRTRIADSRHWKGAAAANRLFPCASQPHSHDAKRIRQLPTRANRPHPGKAVPAAGQPPARRDWPRAVGGSVAAAQSASVGRQYGGANASSMASPPVCANATSPPKQKPFARTSTGRFTRSAQPGGRSMEYGS